MQDRLPFMTMCLNVARNEIFCYLLNGHERLKCTWNQNRPYPLRVAAGPSSGAVPPNYTKTL